MKDLQKLFQRDRFAEYVSLEVLEVAPGKAKVCLKIREEHLQTS